MIYRQKETAKIYHLVKGGDSCLLIGPSGVGKSTFAKNLLLKGSSETFLKERVLSVYLSVEDLPQLKSTEFFRLYLKKLVDAVNERRLNFSVVEEMEVYSQASELFLLEKIRALLKLLVTDGFRVVVAVDGLERLADAFDQSFFAALKSLRDAGFPKFSYLFLTRGKVLENGSSQKIEALLKLVSANTFYLKPFSLEDSRKQVGAMAAEREITFDKDQLEKIMAVGGGFASFLKLGVQYLDKNRQASPEELADQILKDPSAQLRLSEIYTSLSPGEKTTLKRLCQKQTSTDKISQKSLEEKGIINEGKIFSPLLEKYVLVQDQPLFEEPEVKERAGTPPAGIFIDPQTRRVYLDGREIINLTKQEFRLLEYLYQNPEKICHRDEIIPAVWEGGEEGISDEAIDQLVTRLRTKIEKDKSNPQHLLTIRGRGFAFKP